MLTYFLKLALTLWGQWSFGLECRGGLSCASSVSLVESYQEAVPSQRHECSLGVNEVANR
ncbi:hypothetical protein D3C80_2140440 [compost metagenome]